MSESNPEQPMTTTEKPGPWWGSEGAVGLANAAEREREERIVTVITSGYRKRRHPFRLLRAQVDRQGGPR